MSFFIGYLIGSVVTIYLVYRFAKKKKAEAEKLLESNAQSLNNKNSNKGDEEEL